MARRWYTHKRLEARFTTDVAMEAYWMLVCSGLPWIDIIVYFLVQAFNESVSFDRRTNDSNKFLNRLLKIGRTTTRISAHQSTRLEHVLHFYWIVSRLEMMPFDDSTRRRTDCRLRKSLEEYRWLKPRFSC